MEVLNHRQNAVLGSIESNIQRIESQGPLDLSSLKNRGSFNQIQGPLNRFQQNGPPYQNVQGPLQQSGFKIPSLNSFQNAFTQRIENISKILDEDPSMPGIASKPERPQIPQPPVFSASLQPQTNVKESIQNADKLAQWSGYPISGGHTINSNNVVIASVVQTRVAIK